MIKTLKQNYPNTIVSDTTAKSNWKEVSSWCHFSYVTISSNLNIKFCFLYILLYVILSCYMGKCSSFKELHLFIINVAVISVLIIMHHELLSICSCKPKI